MLYGFKLLPKNSFKEEVSQYMRNGIKHSSGKAMAEKLHISIKYANGIAYEEGTPLQNIDLCADIIGTNMAFFYAVVVPKKFIGKGREYGLDVFHASPMNLMDVSSGSYKSSFESPIFRLSGDLYKRILDYWRNKLYNGESGKGLERVSDLSDATINHAIRGDISPRCSTVQKLLSAYGMRMAIIIKPGKKLCHDTIKILN